MAGEDILKLIDKAVEEKTFSLDGLSAVQKIKDQVILSNARIEELTTWLKQKEKHNDELKAAIKEKEFEIAKWKTRENELVEREKKHIDLEKNCAVSVAVQIAQDKMFERLFANRQFRESVVESSTRAVPNQVPGGYPTTLTETSNKTTTTEEA